METILKSIILYATEKKWSAYYKDYHHFFKEREDLFDDIIDEINDFYLKYSLFPDWANIQKSLTSTGEDKLLGYLSEIIGSPNVPAYESDLDFITNLKVQQTLTYEMDLAKSLQGFSHQYTTMDKKDDDSISEKVEEYISELHGIKNRVNKIQGSNFSILHGPNASQDLIEKYYESEKRRLEGDTNYYTVGIPEFEPIHIKKGDLVFFGGFTSHGKSIYLRYLTYRLAVEYGLNSVFFSFEMSHDVVKEMFYLLHANNKNIFPKTPSLPYTSVKNGHLSEEQKDFYHNVVMPDLDNNPDYGTIIVDQPNKSSYNINDLNQRIREIETAVMPIDVCCLDYLSMMYPLEGNTNRNSNPSDYNEMIKKFKNIALTHRNAKGDVSPFIALTACQMSRQGLDNCLKNDRLYDLSAIYMYSEIERSADLFFSVLMTNDMKTENKSRVQCLKVRDGGIILDPVDVYVELAEGMSICQIKPDSPEDYALATDSIDL